MIVRGLLFSIALVSVAACGGQVEEGGSRKDDAGAAADGSTTETFDVASLPGLVLWLDANVGVVTDAANAHVTTWTDRSPEHNDLTLLQGLGATFDANLGSSSTLRFDGATAYGIAASPKLEDWSGDFLVEIAVRVDTTNPDNQAFFSCFGDRPSPQAYTLAETYITKGQTAACDVLANGYSDNASTEPVVNIGGYLVGFRRIGAQYESRRNGVVDATVTVKHVTMPKCTTSFFGALPLDATSKLEGFSSSSIAEVIIVKGTVGDDVVEKLETSLRSKFDLPNF